MLLAGGVAGFINVVVGSGTLISFPTLVMLGVPPVVANMSNTVGLVGGSVAGSIGYRRELSASTSLIRLLLPASILGAIVGALALLVLPASVFRMVVPALIAIGVILVLLGPRLARRRTEGTDAALSPGRKIAAITATFALGIYGGYFGAAQGIILMGVLGIITSATLQSLNGIKNLTVLSVNLVAAIVFVVVAGASINWLAAGLIAVGSTLGGIAGARVGRRIPDVVLRWIIAVVGVAAIVYQLFLA